MEVRCEKKNEIAIVTPVGRIDTSTAKAFEDGVMKSLSEEKQVVISFLEVSYISSAGLRVILMAGKKITSVKGKLALIDMSNKILDVFKMSGFDKIIKIYPDFNSASTAFAE